MRYVFLALFAAVSLVHLYHSWLDVTKKRRMTKWALLLLLLGYYLTSTSTFAPLLIAALLCSWLGDVLLMPSGNAWFVSGGISFLAAHVLFVLLYLGQVDFAAVNWLIAVPVALVYIAAVTVILALLKKETPKPMFVPMFLYLLMNGAMNFFALMQLLTNPCAGAAVAYLGAILFFVSDSTLYLNKYYKKKQIIPKKHFTIMITYLLGEFLIVQGMLMLGL